MATRPGTVLGTMEFGRGPCVDEVPQTMVDLCLNTSADFRGLDTALMYSGGKSEAILGSIDTWKGVTPMATKINPWEGKGLGERSVREQVEASLARLQVSSVDILYLHAPDHSTPLTETLGAMDRLHREGKFRQLGLSNYSSWLVSEVANLCKANHWVRPSVYQGMYSAITRQVEAELLPCLRYHGIAFYAYSPLGGGLLTGKHRFEQLGENTVTSGRFNGVDQRGDHVYRGRYWKQEHFSAMETLKALLEKHHPGMTMIAAALCWIYNYSLLDGSRGDCVVLGASRVEQLAGNLQLAGAGELHSQVVEFLEEWWRSTSHLCPSYLR